MGRMKILAALGALTLPLLSLPAAAQNKGLDCMESRYSESQLNEVRSLGSSLVDGGQLNELAMNSLSELAQQAAGDCAELRGWNEGLLAVATLYELGRISEIAYRQGDDLTAQQFAMIDEALATGNRDVLWSIVEGSVIGGMDGEPDPISDNDALILGLFAFEAGLISMGSEDDESEAMGEKVGVLLGFMALQRIGERIFLSLE